MHPFLKKLFVSEIACIHLDYTSRDTYTINLIVAQRKKNSVELIQKNLNLLSLQDVSENLPEKTPVLVVVTGTVIINRILPTNKTEKYIAQIAPNSNPDDFFINEYALDTTNTLVSLARKELILEIQKELNELKIPVIQFSIGLAHLWFAFQCNIIKTTPINFKETVIYLPENRIENKRNSDIQETIQILQDETLAFTVATHYLMQAEALCKSNGIVVVNESFLFQQITKKVLVVSGITLFAILLINFILFSTLTNKNTLLQNEIRISGTTIQKIDSLKGALLKKEQIIKELNLDQQTQYAYLLDQIALTLPRYITLESITFNSAGNKVNENKLIEYQKGIFISGTDTRGLQLNNWIDILEKTELIRKVQVLTYELIETKGAFELFIEFKD